MKPELLSNDKKRGVIRKISHFRWSPIDLLIYLHPRDSEVYREAVSVRAGLIKLINAIERTITYKGRAPLHSAPIDNHQAKIMQDKIDEDAYPFDSRKK